MPAFLAFLLLPIALAADSLAGVELGSMFNAAAWAADPAGTYLRPVEVAGLRGELAPELCGGRIRSLTFTSTFTNVSPTPPGTTPSSSPREGAESARRTLVRGLESLGYHRQEQSAIWIRTVGPPDGMVYRMVPEVVCSSLAEGVVCFAAAMAMNLDTYRSPCTTGL